MISFQRSKQNYGRTRIDLPDEDVVEALQRLGGNSVHHLGVGPQADEISLIFDGILGDDAFVGAQVEIAILGERQRGHIAWKIAVARWV